MLDATRLRLDQAIAESDLVLDIGGWADPFPRADWVLDLFPYETRGLYERRGWVEGREALGPERFSADTWVVRDICDREPFPFADEQFDFVICSHTLEDIRDPVWVCSEMSRISKAGYVEVPSRLEEQTWGVHGEFVGWTHHRWLIDVDQDAAAIDFVFKLHHIHSNPLWYFPPGFHALLSEEEKVSWLLWEGSFDARERVIFEESEATEVYLGEFVAEALAARGLPPRQAPAPPQPSLGRRALWRARAALPGRQDAGGT